MPLEDRNVAFALGVKGGRIMVDDHGKEEGYSLMHQMLTECMIIMILTIIVMMRMIYNLYTMYV